MSSFEHSIQEMRGRNRVEVSEVIHVADRQSGETLGQLVNISEEGFMLLGSQPVTEDNIFQLSGLMHLLMKHSSGAASTLSIFLKKTSNASGI